MFRTWAAFTGFANQIQTHFQPTDGISHSISRNYLRRALATTIGHPYATNVALIPSCQGTRWAKS